MDRKPLADQQIAQTNPLSCSTEEEQLRGFCGVISVPYGFQLIPYCKLKLFHNLGGLGTVL
ncbi:hypothetical protein [Bacillus thuringiensis]|uniref:hypothetical protein n=1 Tax=Bacillus thuringiensis TaxID=1428 RepID=UPI0020CFD1B0|nr:hypothetical protein [Bacillus thuringiensis]MED3183853.1 hypothetical protein [Bacillus thuringiensis]